MTKNIIANKLNDQHPKKILLFYICCKTREEWRAPEGWDRGYKWKRIFERLHTSFLGENFSVLLQ